LRKDFQEKELGYGLTTDPARIANVRLRTEPSVIFQLSSNAPARVEGRRAMMASGIGEKFIGSYRGEGTLASAVRSADAKSVEGKTEEENTMGRGLLLWLIGIPLPIILLIWLFGGLH
jgi:hypothetical protein